jgi:hypothetical protein
MSIRTYQEIQVLELVGVEDVHGVVHEQGGEESGGGEDLGVVGLRDVGDGEALCKVWSVDWFWGVGLKFVVSCRRRVVWWCWGVGLLLACIGCAVFPVLTSVSKNSTSTVAPDPGSVASRCHIQMPAVV